jgi:rod shape-determining protein MreC
MIKQKYLFVFLGLTVLVILALSQSAKTQQKMRQVALDASAPVLNTFSRTKSFFTKVDTGLQTLQEAQAELEKLRTENSQLKMEVDVQRDLSKENDRLREMLGFKTESQFKLLPCRVISRDPSNWWNSVQINRGWYDDKNLDKDMPVVSPRGVIGKTSVVSKHITEVILLVDENCKIAAAVQGSNVQGIVVGDSNYQEGRPRARMKFIDRNASISVGELVFTSGLGGVFPQGLLIGTVAEVPPLSASSNFGLYREAIIEPAVDLRQLDELFIIVGAK